jgi:hypothetical protein
MEKKGRRESERKDEAGGREGGREGVRRTLLCSALSETSWKWQSWLPVHGLRTQCPLTMRHLTLSVSMATVGEWRV